MFILTECATIGNIFIAEMRDVLIQKDSLRFRYNMQRVGELLAYELSKKLTYEPRQVTTPLGQAHMDLITEPPVLATILRAGLPFHEGFVRMFDRASCAFIGSFRGKYKPDHSFDVEMHYLTSPDINNKPLVVTDPMLATGKSLLKAVEALLLNGTPSQLFIAAAIASKEGVAYIQKHLPQAQLYVGTVDPELNDKCYIVPGLGDAGDLSFGPKL